MPWISRKPETGWAGGLVMARIYKPDEDENLRPSFLKAQALYTQKKQFILELSFETFRKNNKHWLKTEFELTNYLDRYFGKGNNTLAKDKEDYSYNSQKILVNPRLALTKKLYSGILLDFKKLSKVKSLDEKDIHNKLLPGAGGSNNIGLGINLTFDTRDNRFNCCSGLLLDLKLTRYVPIFNKGFNYTLFDSDLRFFGRIGPGTVLAFQNKIKGAKGNVPFYELPSIGSNKIMRGLFDSRFSDRQMISSQLEFRQKLYRRMGFVLFASNGKVGDTYTDLFNQNWHYTYGGGLRLEISTMKKINGRLDFGFTPDGQNAWYVSITEAF